MKYGVFEIKCEIGGILLMGISNYKEGSFLDLMYFKKDDIIWDVLILMIINIFEMVLGMIKNIIDLVGLIV